LRVDEAAELAEKRQAEIERLRAVLSQIEWIIDDECDNQFCPACNQWKTDKHKKDCQLKAALDAKE